MQLSLFPRAPKQLRLFASLPVRRIYKVMAGTDLEFEVSILVEPETRQVLHIETPIQPSPRKTPCPK